jgi:hypothetical protein
MNCHALFALIDARKRWEEQQTKLALKEAAKAEAAMVRAKKRCSATTAAGTRCRCHADAEGGMCATHRRHGDRKTPEPTLTTEELAAVNEEIRTESEDYQQFCRSYYNILRELYNVAGAEMAEEFIRFKTLGRGRFSDFHTKKFSKFREHIE